MAARHFAASHKSRPPRRLRVAPICTALALICATATLSGCIADGPDGAPLAPDLAAASGSTPAERDAARKALATGVKPSSRDVRIAAREARQARESGTISGSAVIDRLIEQHARENGLPPALAYAVVRVESRYNPRARGGSAMGLSQIKPATARSLGFSGPASALLDADTNLTYGMKYLKGAWEQGGHDVCRASMKYKGGHRTTRMTSAALRYCSAVKAHMAEVVRQRSRMAGGAAEPESQGLVETLVATVTPDSATAGSGSGSAARTPNVTAFATREDGGTRTSGRALLPVSISAERIARPKMAAKPSVPVPGAGEPAARHAAPPASAPANGGGDTVDSRIAEAFD